MTNLSTLPGFTTASSGGGGGGGTIPVLATLTDTASFTCGADTRTAYNYTSGHIAAQAPSGVIKNRDTFAYWAQWMDQTNGHSGFTISSYRVNPSTGALTQLQGGHQDVWVNTSASAMSTTYCGYDPVHGCFFSGGHNAYPGQGAHYFGYTAGQVRSDGVVYNGQYSSSNADHGSNGTFCACLPQGTGANYFRSIGYNAGSGSYAGGRTHTAQSSGITVGSRVDDGNWTSSTGYYCHIYQPDINTTPSGEVTSINGTSFNSPNYGFITLRGNSKTNLQPMAAGASTGELFAGYNGISVHVVHDNHFGTLGNPSNNYTSLKDGNRDLGSHTATHSYTQDIVGIGNNRFLFFNTNENEGSTVDLVDFDSNNNPRHIQRFSYGGGAADRSVLDKVADTRHYFVVFESNTDTYPKWIVEASTATGSTTVVKTFEITADISSYNP